MGVLSCPLVCCLDVADDGHACAEQRIRATKAGRMFLNLLKVHSMAYNAIKALNPVLQVGLVHQFIEMVPERKWHYPVSYTHLTLPTKA